MHRGQRDYQKNEKKKQKGEKKKGKKRDHIHIETVNVHQTKK